MAVRLISKGTCVGCRLACPMKTLVAPTGRPSTARWKVSSCAAMGLEMNPVYVPVVVEGERKFVVTGSDSGQIVALVVHPLHRHGPVRADPATEHHMGVSGMGNLHMPAAVVVPDVVPKRRPHLEVSRVSFACAGQVPSAAGETGALTAAGVAALAAGASPAHAPRPSNPAVVKASDVRFRFAICSLFLMAGLFPCSG